LKPDDPGQLEETLFARQRLEMVQQQIENRGIKEKRVLAAMNKVPRHMFVDDRLKAEAYKDRPLAIGKDQTISQPYIVAFMSAAAESAPMIKFLKLVRAAATRQFFWPNWRRKSIVLN